MSPCNYEFQSHLYNFHHTKERAEEQAKLVLFLSLQHSTFSSLYLLIFILRDIGFTIIAVSYCVRLCLKVLMHPGERKLRESQGKGMTKKGGLEKEVGLAKVRTPPLCVSVSRTTALATPQAWRLHRTGHIGNLRLICPSTGQ